ncbi:hypothetical protein VTI28DRAFT_779 [Corynascus sepedonium]
MLPHPTFCKVKPEPDMQAHGRVRFFWGTTKAKSFRGKVFRTPDGRTRSLHVPAQTAFFDFGQSMVMQCHAFEQRAEEREMPLTSRGLGWQVHVHSYSYDLCVLLAGSEWFSRNEESTGKGHSPVSRGLRPCPTAPQILVWVLSDGSHPSSPEPQTTHRNVVPVCFAVDRYILASSAS